MKPNRKLKKPQPSCCKFDLEEIIGLTVSNGNGLAASTSYSKCVYIAGCAVVVYNVDSGTQSHLMVSNRSPKPLSCVSVSQDGSYIAAGESGHQPAILVWASATLASASELKGHRFGVACMAFSPDGKHLVSVGSPEDGYLCLWDWRNRILVKKLKACSSLSAVASINFSPDANFIFTAGKRHLKIWTVGLPTKARAKTGALSLTMHGKAVNLGHLKGCSFISVTSPSITNRNLADGKSGELGLVYALTDAGVLCCLHGGFTITHSVDLKVQKGLALSASQEFVACACNNGVVKLYTIGNLEYAGGLHYSEEKQSNKTTNAHWQSKVSQYGIQPLSTFPDAIACRFSASEKLVVVYRDHSLYIWNIHGKYKATKCCVLVSHSACIWDIKNLSCENMHDPSLACVARGCTGGVSFATCSADGTIRLWDFALQSVSTESSSTFATDQHHVTVEPFGTSCLVSAGTFERESVVSGVVTQGYRSMAVSSDGKHLAAGDSDGNLHIYNLYTSDYTCIQDAHDAEIFSLNFSLPVKNRGKCAEDLESYYFLASGGRDRMIHLFDVNRNFELIASVDDHSAAVTSVKLTGNGRKILSCSSDRSLIFRDVAVRGMVYSITHCHHQKASHGAVYDMAVDPMTEIAVTVGQDKKINTFNIAAGQVIRSFKQGGEFGYPIKVALDPSCSYVVCSYSDRSICMYDFLSGEMVARAMGHGEAINGIIFLPDCKHLVSVGSDGCIFVWKMPTLLASRMLQRINENSCALYPSTIPQPAALNQIKPFEGNDFRSRIKPTGAAVLGEAKCPQETPTFKFSVSRLPQWAKSKVSSPSVIPMDPGLCKAVGEDKHSPSRSNGGEDARVHPALHTPSNNDTDATKRFPERSSGSSSDSSNGKGSSTTHESCRNFALDKHWLTIHTVCLDLLNSPELYGMREPMVPLSSNLLHGPALETRDVESMTPSSTNPTVTRFSLNHASSNSNVSVGPAAYLNDHVELNNSGCLSNNIDQHEFGDEFALESSDQQQLQLSTSVNRVADTCILNTSNNSANSKTEARKLSARKSYSARFFVRRDHLRVEKVVLDLPVNNLADSSLEHEDSQTGSSSEQATMSKDQEEWNIMGNEKQKTLDACKEALRRLDTLTKDALEVFARLGDITSPNKNPEGPEARFYAEAEEMLPSIAKTVHEMAKMVSLDKVDTPGFEPLLGRFADSLSQRVIELLKQNSTSSLL